ncbi:MAG: glutathione S-transferase family protein [Pseudomonadota bacterium]
MSLHLISHTLCPYVQRAAISLAEKEVRFERTYIDLANKPDWFLAVSPLGKTPVLLKGEVPIFESAVILEYLEETQPNPLHPRDALERARHRAWMEFGSSVLNDIAGFYSASDDGVFRAKIVVLREKFKRLEAELGAGPYFAGDRFSLVDVVFGPVFRYFNVFEEIGAFGILTDLPKVDGWRQALGSRGSVEKAVGDEYPSLLRAFLLRRNSYLSSLMRTNEAGHSATVRLESQAKP